MAQPINENLTLKEKFQFELNEALTFITNFSNVVIDRQSYKITSFSPSVLVIHFEYFCNLYIIGRCYEELGDFDNALKYSLSAKNFISLHNFEFYDYVDTLNESLIRLYNENCRQVYFRCARLGDFDSFLTANEWYRSKSKKFYLYRREVLIKNGFIQALQGIHDKKYTTTLIESPVGIGKSVLGVQFAVFMKGRGLIKKKPARILVSNSTSSLTKGFYNDIYNYLTDKEYAFAEIFRCADKTIIGDAEGYQIWFDKKAREPDILCCSVEVGATGKIHIDEDGLIYLDDLIANSEQASSADFLEKRCGFLSSAILDRKENDKVPVLHIGTPWSVGDTGDYLEKKCPDYKKMQKVSVPCYSYVEGKKVTNWGYDDPHFKSVEYWDSLVDIETDKFIADAKFFNKRRKREGSVITKLEYFRWKDLEEKTKTCKPFVTSATDVAVAVEGDYLASGYFYYFEDVNECWLIDLIYSNAGINTTIPEVIKKHIAQKVEKSEFEEKEGIVSKTNQYNMGYAKEILSGIEEKMREGRKLKCNINSHSGAGLKSKANRIQYYVASIQGIKTIARDDKGNVTIEKPVYRFLHPEDVKQMGLIQYEMAMNHLWSYHPEFEPDDFPDMLAQNMFYNIDIPISKPKKATRVSMKFFGR